MPEELDMQREKDHQSISFSGISVIIDTMIKSNSRAALRVNRPEIESAVNTEDHNYLEELFEGSEDREGLHAAISLAVERNKPAILEKLLSLTKEGEAK
ncbi:Uncharacterized protein FKW44_023567, partial [Caligus rogercresseyi]